MDWFRWCCRYINWEDIRGLLNRSWLSCKQKVINWTWWERKRWNTKPYCWRVFWIEDSFDITRLVWKGRTCCYYSIRGNAAVRKIHWGSREKYPLRHFTTCSFCSSSIPTTRPDFMILSDDSKPVPRREPHRMHIFRVHLHVEVSRSDGLY